MFVCMGGVIFGGASGKGCVWWRGGEETEVDARKIWYLRAKCRCPIFAR